MKKLLSNLTFQVIVAILLGVIVGLYFKQFGPTAQLISNKFIDMIKMLIPFIIFLTIVLGIAGMGDMKKVGRVGGKAILYFEIVTTFALIMGVALANIIKPGSGLPAPHGATNAKLQVYQKAAAEMKWGEFFCSHYSIQHSRCICQRGNFADIILRHIVWLWSQFTEGNRQVGSRSF